jgi:hypothetical protein
MKAVRQEIGGLGNLMFKEAYLMGQTLDGVIPDVYVQSSKYWKHHAASIKAKFAQGIGRSDAIALHIRRGDYVGNDFYMDLWKTDYYKKAIALFPGERFIVFCRDNQGWDRDKADRQWCRYQLAPILGNRFELPSKDNTETDDMNLMASCKGIIMANSSFSWWASFINPNPDKKIVCPREWFTDNVQRCDPEPEWTLI